MTPASTTAYAAALLSSVLALAVVLLTRRRSVAAWCFAAGLLLLAIESALAGRSILATDPVTVERWQTLSLMVTSVAPATWLAFSLTYSRGNPGAYLVRWRMVLAAAFLIPAGLAIGFRSELVREILALNGGQDGWWIRYGPVARMLSILSLVVYVGILANIERTFRAAVGTMQWRVKFAVVGIGLIFGVRIYYRSQVLLFSGYGLNRSAIEASALIIACLLMMIAHMRRGFAEVDIYPSRAVLQNSVTVLLAGGYLFVVGVLAQLAATVGDVGSFQLQSVVVLVGVTVLAILLLSNRLRQAIQLFISRHFRRPQHDSRVIWTRFTGRLSNVFDQGAYCAETVKLLAETFNALSVTLLLFDELRGRLTVGASTSVGHETGGLNQALAAPEALQAGLRGMTRPFDPDKVSESWAEPLRDASLAQFRQGGRRICLPLFVGERGLGVAVLADRVNAIPYSVEEIDILKCIADHVAAGLLQLRLTEELMQGRELDAFQAMSTFFVHDLKNAASSLSLMSENLPEHFDDPAFRDDALRGIASNAGRINQIIERLASLRQKPSWRPLQSTSTN